MLALSRRSGQSIKIGEDIEVRVVKVQDNGVVRIGITAPRGVPITRPDKHKNTPPAANG